MLTIHVNIIFSIRITAANLTLSLCKGFHKAGYHSSNNSETAVSGYGEPQVDIGKMMTNLHLLRNA